MYSWVIWVVPIYFSLSLLKLALCWQPRESDPNETGTWIKNLIEYFSTSFFREGVGRAGLITWIGFLLGGGVYFIADAIYLAVMVLWLGARLRLGEDH